MTRQMLGFIAVLFLLSVLTSAQQTSDKPWHFAVSGDSRNCGDVVMPAIAKSVRSHGAEFYWHLGDFRAGYDVDEDMQPRLGEKMPIDEYHKVAWDDFIRHQVEPFTPIAVHLGIGNHEMYMHENTPAGQDASHAEFITKFSKWLGGSKTAYYHRKSHQVDFISMDNSTNAGFEDAQLQWFEKVLQEDRTDNAVKAVVVGMHRALPNSLACGHSMNGDPASSAEDNLKSLQSGRRAYEDLWDFQNTAKKHVYVLASHSHFYMQGIFNTAYWHHHAGSKGGSANDVKEEKVNPLEGWLVGTAGAQRYRLPDNLPSNAPAITYAYGYLLGSVHRDGTIDFRFEQVVEDDVPHAITDKRRDLVDYCFLANRDNTAHTPVESCGEQ
jgi:hypothetical protein